MASAVLYVSSFILFEDLCLPWHYSYEQTGKQQLDNAFQWWKFSTVVKVYYKNEIK